MTTTHLENAEAGSYDSAITSNGHSTVSDLVEDNVISTNEKTMGENEKEMEAGTSSTDNEYENSTSPAAETNEVSDIKESAESPMEQNGTKSVLGPSALNNKSIEANPNQQNAKPLNPEERTSELIRKQMNEIEREVNRRMQNKNIRKIDEAELAQLLKGCSMPDNGFGDFVGENGSVGSDWPNNDTYQPSSHSEASTKPTLEQLRSSFSPPDELSMDPSTSGPTITGNGLGLHGPAAFSTNNVLPQSFSPMEYHSQPMVNNQFTTVSPSQFAVPPGIHPFPPNAQPILINGMNTQMGFPNYPQNLPFASYGTQYLPQVASSMPPSITPDMAAAVLQHLQRQNPAFLQNLINQHHFANVPTEGIPTEAAKVEPPPPAAHTIPAPPPPQSIINRKTSVPTAPILENEWPIGQTEIDNTVTSAEPKENGAKDPVWVMRDTFLKRLQREEERNKQLLDEETNGETIEENEEEETDKLLKKDPNEAIEEAVRQRKGSNKKEVMVHEPAVLIEGVLFRARYLGSTQLTSDGRATKSSRMAQAQEAVSRVKAPHGDVQPSTEIDLFISTEKIMVLNTDLQRISETDVRQDILMDHALRAVSYIADIGELVVLMARRVPQAGGPDDDESDTIRRTPRLICHVFESEEASFIVQSIGQAFQVAYVEFLRANGIDDPAFLREVDYQEVLNSQELMGEELEMFARKETQKDVIIAKRSGEPLGIVVVESGWGSMLPTVVVAHMNPGGAASRSNSLNIGDQIIAINGISLVGLQLAAAQQNIKNAKSSTAVRLTVVSAPPVVEVRIKRPDTKYQLGFSVQNGVICSLLRGGIAERGGIRVGHRIIDINHVSVVSVPHEKIVNMLATATGEIYMKTMPTSMYRLVTGQEVPNYI